MKWVFFLLLALNLVFGGYAYLREHTPNPDAQLLGLQMNASQVKIVPPREVPPPAPQAVAAAVPERTACLEWGSFGASEITRAQAAIDKLGIGERAHRKQVSVSTGYWVYMPPQKSKADMDKKVSELKELGVTDYFPMLEPGRWRYAISLGIFRSEDGAKRYLAQLREKGVRSALIGEREQRATQTAFTIIEPTGQESAQLVELKAEFPGSDLHVAECPSS